MTRCVRCGTEVQLARTWFEQEKGRPRGICDHCLLELALEFIKSDSELHEQFIESLVKKFGPLPKET